MYDLIRVCGVITSRIGGGVMISQSCLFAVSCINRFPTIPYVKYQIAEEYG